MPKIVPAIKDEPYNNYYSENKKTDETRALENVPENHF